MKVKFHSQTESEDCNMNFYISAEELAQRKHINFSVDLDESGLLISSCPQEIVTPTLVQQPAAGLLTDLNHLTWGIIINKSFKK